MNDAEINRRFRDLFLGFSHMTGEVLLSASPATTTTVSRVGLSANGVPILVPIDANAAAEAGGTALYVVTATNEFTIHHSPSASERRFRWVAFYGPSVPN